MTLEELEQRLPNGLHDAELVALRVDFEQLTIELRLRIDMSSLDERSPQYRLALVKLDGLHYFFFEAPDPKLAGEGVSLMIDCGPADAERFPHLKLFLDALPAAVTPYWFYLHQWNTRFHLAAREAELMWLEEAAVTS